MIVNASFEAAGVPAGQVQVVRSRGWTTSVSENVIETWGTGHRAFEASNGTQFVELNGDGPDSITQTVTVLPGQQYRWSVDHQGRVDTDTIEVIVNGKSQGRFTAQPGTWSTHTGVVAVDAAQATITIRALDAGSLGNLVDNVRFIRID